MYDSLIWLQPNFKRGSINLHIFYFNCAGYFKQLLATRRSLDLQNIFLSLNFKEVGRSSFLWKAPSDWNNLSLRALFLEFDFFCKISAGRVVNRWGWMNYLYFFTCCFILILVYSSVIENRCHTSKSVFLSDFLKITRTEWLK